MTERDTRYDYIDHLSKEELREVAIKLHQRLDKLHADIKWHMLDFQDALDTAMQDEAEGR